MTLFLNVFNCAYWLFYSMLHLLNHLSFEQQSLFHCILSDLHIDVTSPSADGQVLLLSGQEIHLDVSSFPGNNTVEYLCCVLHVLWYFHAALVVNVDLALQQIGLCIIVC